MLAKASVPPSHRIAADNYMVIKKIYGTPVVKSRISNKERALLGKYDFNQLEYTTIKQINEELSLLKKWSMSLDKTLKEDSDRIIDIRLKELKKKWNEIIDLTKENSIVLADEKVSGDFLMFLLDAIPHGEEGVKICKYGSDIEILDKAGKKISMINPVGEKKTQEEKVLFNLICLAPKKVLIYDEKSYSDEFLNIVKKFF